jgi:2-keto-4-pentenoate hydratase
MPANQIPFTELAQSLRSAEDQRVAIRPLTEQYPDLTVADAYEIQRQNIATRIRAGERAVGRKIGLTSQAMQRLIGVKEPDYGTIMDTMVISEDQTLHRQRLLYPRVEGEIAFVLEKDLEGPGLTIPTVLKATAGVMACLEIVDSRIADWKIKLPDTIADNGSSARVVFGGALVPVTQLDLRLLGMILEKDGQIAGTATGAAALGHPAHAVAWLVNKLADFGLGLKAGEFVLSGALTAAVNVEAGSVVRATFDRLGSVSVRFV